MSDQYPSIQRTDAGEFIVRQSTLRGFGQCARRSYHDITSGLPQDVTYGYSEATSDLGTLVHAVAAEILRTLWSQNEEQIPTQEAIEIMREVYSASSIVLPSEEMHDLVWLTLQIAGRKWKAHKLMTTMDGTLAVEQRIVVPVQCPDGQTRYLACQPDALFAGSSGTIVCPDYKSGKGKPKRPKQPQEGLPDDTARGREHLSDRGHFQADAYGLAAMHAYPSADRFIFRELFLRWNLISEAVIAREELEHVEKLVGIHLMKLDRAMTEGDASQWKPRPGPWCQRACPVQDSCPVPREQRGRGAIATLEDADTVAAAYVVADAQRQHLRELLKVNWEQTGRPAQVGDGTLVVWDQGKGGAFGIVDAGEYAAQRAAMVPDTLTEDLEASLRAAGKL